jgi:dihydrolipoamide dehydrogenase
MGEPEGQIRLICEGSQGDRGGKVLGIHVMGPHASEIVAQGTLAINLGATAADLAHTMVAHPTLSECVMEAAKGQLDGSIHFMTL